MWSCSSAPVYILFLHTHTHTTHLTVCLSQNDRLSSVAASAGIPHTGAEKQGTLADIRRMCRCVRLLMCHRTSRLRIYKKTLSRDLVSLDLRRKFVRVLCCKKRKVPHECTWRPPNHTRPLVTFRRKSSDRQTTSIFNLNGNTVTSILELHQNNEGGGRVSHTHKQQYSTFLQRLRMLVIRTEIQ